jgi:hypothetical protein
LAGAGPSKEEVALHRFGLWYTALIVAVTSLIQPEGPVAQDDPDAQAWDRARELGTYGACQSYLEEFPTGRFADQAFRCMIEQSIEEELGPVDAGPQAIY